MSNETSPRTQQMINNGQVENEMSFNPLSSHRALTNMKLRLKGAQKGHSLLKKKADALTLRFRSILKKIIEVSTGLEHFSQHNILEPKYL